MSGSLNTTTPDGATYDISQKGGLLRLTISGRLDAVGTASLWTTLTGAVADSKSYTAMEANLSAITYMDGSGAALLYQLRQLAKERKTDLTLVGLREQDRLLVESTWDKDLPQWRRNDTERRSLAVKLGEATNESLTAMKAMITFVGEATVLLFQALLHPKQVRWKDVLLSCINVGVDALFILALIGFLMGLIMSFQSAVSLQRFGGEIFVPNMLGLVMFREMGPLVTSILLAARSGSAFAAEIGTMKINEELDALTTMGLSPMRFLVVPKILSTMIVIPLMTMFFNLASLVGGAVVMLSMGYPLVTFTSRVFAYLQFDDFWGGMAKSVVFSFLVAGVGCLRGMQTRSGASAVGLSTTSAVVSGIILIAFADGLFAMAFYYLGI